MKISINIKNLAISAIISSCTALASADLVAPQPSCDEQRAQQWTSFQSEKLSAVLPEMSKMMGGLSSEDYAGINRRFFGPRDEAEFNFCMEKCVESATSRGGDSSSCNQFCEQVSFVDKIKTASDWIAAKTGVALEYSDIESGVTREFLADYSNIEVLSFGFEVTLRSPKGDAWFKTPHLARKKFEFSVLGSPTDKNLQVEICTTDLIRGPGICTDYQSVSEYMESQLPSICTKLNSEAANNFYRVNW